MKKVLIITYYWPPSGGAGVQRWLKFAKYLREFGWEPVIYTPENPEAPAIDHSLLKDIPKGIEVIKTPIKEPYTIYKRFVGKKKDDSIKAGFLSEKKNPGLAEKISVWIRGNLFIPDARKFWIKPSIRFLKNYLSENPVDAMVSTGPPHSMHMIALGVKKALGIPWLADFRDPWTNIDFYDKLMLTKRADRKHRALEKMVIRTSEISVAVNRRMGSELKELGAQNVEVIYNGFDPDDFKGVEHISTGKFEILHFGSINSDRNPVTFWKVLRQFINENPEVSGSLNVTLIGFVDHSVSSEISKNDLEKFVHILPYQSHNDIILKASGASIFLLPLNNTPNAKGITSGKLFEYLALNRPVYCIGPENGDAASIIRECNAGISIDFYDKEKMKTYLKEFYSLFREQKLDNNIDLSKTAKYSRIHLTRQLAENLDKIVLRNY
ncbi:MAG: glycosyltransferase [Bacteroidales bacterium]|nr:glycosyltransferase [Bacteroidales bacterium]